MKILIAHLGSNWVNMCGGVERVTCNLANALVDRGHEVSKCLLYTETGARESPIFLWIEG